MSKLIPTTRTNDCPVCGDISGKCRTKNDGGQPFVLCVEEAVTKQFEIVSGWKCVKAAGASRWATFTIDDGSTQATAEERQQKRAQREAEERQRFMSGLPVRDRHYSHMQLVSQLELHAADRADLERRGLPESVIDTFISVGPWHRLSIPVDARTPGVGADGGKLNTKYSGYLVPALDLDAQVQAYQIRNRATGSDDPKYPWLSTFSNPANLQSGDLPLTFARGSGQVTSSKIYLGEGLLKPLVASFKHDISLIGAAGGMFASSPKQFADWIDHLSPSELILCPDGGAIYNPDVMREYSKLNALAESLGYELKVLWWGQHEKTGCDIDEITSAQFEQAATLSWAEFKAKDSSQRISVPLPAAEPAKPVLKAKADRPVAAVKALDEKAQKRENWLKAVGAIAGLQTDATPTKEAINKSFMSQQLLPAQHTEGTYEAIALAPANERRLYLLDGQKGTRKTSVASKSLMDRAKVADMSCLVIVPSRLLSRDASRVLEATCHLDSGAESARYLVTCPESLYKFARQQWDVVVIDEVNEDIQRTFDGSLGVNPDLCQRVLEEILKTASTIAIANDQMYRPSVKAVQRLSGIMAQEVVTVQRRRPQSDVAMYLYLDWTGGEEENDDDDSLPTSSDARYGWISQLVEEVECGGKVAIPCGSQTFARILDRVLRSHFKAKGFRGQVLDGVATPTKIKSEFAANPDQWLAVHQPRWLIWTPAFNSGVSIESDYFTAQFEAISVFETANAASQRGERVRAVLGGNITERHVLLSNRGLPACPDPAIFTPEYWRNLSNNIANAKADPSDVALAKSIGAEKFLKHHREDLISKLDKKPELFEFWAIQAREIFFKRETLEAEWRGNGWMIAEGYFEKEDADKWRGLVDEAKQSIIECRSRALAKARAVASEGQDLSPYAAVRAKKHHLGEQLEHEFTRLKDAKWLEAWEIAPDESGGIKAQRIYSLVKMSVDAPELWAAVLKLDTLRTIAAGTEIQNLPSLPIPAKEIAAAKLLTACPGVTDTITGALECWDKTKPVIEEAAQYLRSNADRLATLSQHSQRINGLQFTEATPVIKCFHKALQMAGLTAHAAGRTNKLWQYRLEVVEDCQGKIDSKKAKGEAEAPKDLRNLLRAETLLELQQQIKGRLDTVIAIATEAWQVIADEIAVMGGGVAPTLAAPPTASEEEIEWDDITDEDILKFRLLHCQSYSEYDSTRRELEQYHSDFDAHYWAHLPSEAQHRIYGYFTAIAA